MTAPAGVRAADVLAAQLSALSAEHEATGARFAGGAHDALSWLMSGGPGPSTGDVVSGPVSVGAVVRELAAAEAAMYGPPAERRAVWRPAHRLPDRPRRPRTARSPEVVGWSATGGRYAPAIASARADARLVGECAVQDVHVVPVATELAVAEWRKSRASGPNGNCVEVAALPDGAVALRHSRLPAGPALIYSRAEFAAFVSGVRAAEFDDLVAE